MRWWIVTAASTDATARGNVANTPSPSVHTTTPPASGRAARWISMRIERSSSLRRSPTREATWADPTGSVTRMDRVCTSVL